MVRPHAIKNRLGLRMKKFDNVERKKRQKSVRSREEQENAGKEGEGGVVKKNQAVNP